MTETPQPPAQTLGERAMARLRRLAVGNGVDPAALVAMDTQEQIYTVTGRLDVTALCETQSTSYVGPPKSKNVRPVRTPAELQAAVTQYENEFRASPTWVDDVRKETRATPGEGWGADGAKITLPSKSVVFAATEICPVCNGKKGVPCTQCASRGIIQCPQCLPQGVGPLMGREACYHCLGRGEDPAQPGKRCPICQGTRFAPCRMCMATGQLPCPTCRGRRFMPCTSCQGAGSMTQETSITCGAQAYFKFEAENLPSGLRRGIDRIGLTKLGQGHADIKAEAAARNPGDPPPRPGDKIPLLTYKAEIPYAEMRVDFVVKKAVVAAVGKRCALNGVPNFLDAPLRPFREKLAQAVQGKTPLDEALKARAMNEILSLIVAGKGGERDVRRLYPYGFSSEAINGMLSGLKLALNKMTLITRSVIAVLCGALAALVFYIIYCGGFAAAYTYGRGLGASVFFDGAVFAAMGVVSWALLNFVTRFMLQRRFPKMTFAVNQRIGKTGLAMLAGIAVVFGAVLVLVPVKPLWLALLLRH